MQVGISLDEVFLFGIGHCVGKVQQLLVLLFSLEDLDFLRIFLRSFKDHRATVLEIIKLDLHL